MNKRRLASHPDKSSSNPRFLRRFISMLIMALAGNLWLVGSRIQASEFSILVKIKSQEFQIEAEDIHGRIWVDGIKLAKILGAKTSLKKGIHVWEFAQHTVFINPKESTYKIWKKGEKRGKTRRFEKKIFHDRDQLMILLDSLPEIAGASFSYHYQKRVLEEDLGYEAAGRSDVREAKVGFVTKDRRIWISLKDLAEALGVVVFSSQPGRYGIVMPDFSVLELREGEKEVNKRKQLFARLDDPPLLFSGSLYVTVESIGPLFSVDAHWNSKSRTLILPARYGRDFDKLQISSKLRYVGYRPQAFRFRLEEFSAFYQNPEPTYQYEHDEIYESVRDLFTNEVIDPKTSGFDRVSGHTLLDLQASPFNSPFSGRGSFEKIGSRSRLANGHLEMGFPWLHLRAAREYTTFNGLNNQFNLVNTVSLSHSNDHYGEGRQDLEITTTLSYGELDFSVFLSSALFAQTADFKQTYGMGRIEASADLPNNNRASFKIEQYFFENEAQRISARYSDQDLFEDILGSTGAFFVDTAQQGELSRSFLSDRHSTTIFNFNFKTKRWLDVTSVAGISNYKDPGANRQEWGKDWLFQTTVGNSQNKLDLSYEKSDAQYRSIGSPHRYQNREIYRAASNLSLARWWKVLGQFRREDIGVLGQSGLPAYSNTYAVLSNILSFKTHSFRLSANQYDSGLYGRRANGHVDVTRFFGLHTVDVGGSAGGFWSKTDQMIRRSYTGRASVQWVRPTWKFSLGEEYTWHYYNSFRVNRYESVSSFSAQVDDYQTFLQYKKEPKYFILNDRLYTGVIRLGREVGQRKVINAVYAVTSLHPGLGKPEVWRAGLEYVLDFY